MKNRNRNFSRIFTLAVLVTLLASFVLGSLSAFARPGVGRAVYGDPLCNNPNMTGSRLAGCRAILAQLTESNSCTKPILDRIASAASRGRFGGMNQFCPNYSQFNGDAHTRALIWRNMVAALVMEESSWNPRTSGDGGRSRGLLQFGHGNANQGPYRCACRAAQRNIEDPAANARCGTHIYLYNVARDMHTGGGPAGRPGAYGAARFFGPYGDRQANKRRRMATKVANYCQSLPRQAPPAPVRPPPAVTQPPPLIISGPPMSSPGPVAGAAMRETPLGAPSANRPAPTPMYSSGFMMSFD